MALPRIDTTPIDVLLAVESALQTGLNLTVDQCYLSTEVDDNIPAPAPGDRIVVIEPDGLDFDEGLFIGGGQYQITVQTGVMIHLFSTIRVDSNAKKNRQILINASRGLYALMSSIVSTLAGVDLTVNAGASTFLRELMHPVGASKPEKITDNLVHIAFSWAISYDWANSKEQAQ